MTETASLIPTLAICFTLAVILGFLAQKLKLSPIVGYLLTGVLVGPYTPFFTADSEIAMELAEIGVVLLMFGVGLKFHLNDLMAVKNIATKGALIQIFCATCFGGLLLHFLFKYPLSSSFVYGVSISVASTVVLMRVLSDNNAVHTPTGHGAIGWLVVEDLFTILALVLLPTFFNSTPNSFFIVFILTVLKLFLLVVFTLYIGQKIIPLFLEYISKTGSRDLFTLAILALALGIALGASVFFGASMALGAFLAGIVIGQSDFSARVASEALPLRDASAVLFFVSIGMFFNFRILGDNLGLTILTLFIVLIIKPLSAILAVLFMKQPLKKALSIGVALAQIGEFSFVLIGFSISLKILPQEFLNSIIIVSLISITLNGILYRLIEPLYAFLNSKKIGFKKLDETKKLPICGNEKDSVIVVGYNQIAKTIAPIITAYGMNVIVIEMNFQTVKEINNSKTKGLFALYGDASTTDVLEFAGIECASALVITSASAPSEDIVKIVNFLNPKTKTIIYTPHLSQAEILKSYGVDIVFSAEAEVARSLSKYILKQMAGHRLDI